MPFASKSVIVCVVIAASALAACSSSSATLPGGKTSAEGGAISVFPDKVFVGVDETGKALGTAPVSLTGAAGAVTWTSGTTTIATATGNSQNGTITPVAKGTSTVTIKAGTQTATVAVTVVAYAAADIAKGQAEYTAAKCLDCHATTGTSGPDITPSGVGKHTDDELLGAITSSTNPEGGPITPAHKYTATAAIVAYMRTLAARTTRPVKDE